MRPGNALVFPHLALGDSSKETKVALCRRPRGIPLPTSPHGSQAKPVRCDSPKTIPQKELGLPPSLPPYSTNLSHRGDPEDPPPAQLCKATLHRFPQKLRQRCNLPSGSFGLAFSLRSAVGECVRLALCRERHLGGGQLSVPKSFQS